MATTLSQVVSAAARSPRLKLAAPRARSASMFFGLEGQHLVEPGARLVVLSTRVEFVGQREQVAVSSGSAWIFAIRSATLASSIDRSGCLCNSGAPGCHRPGAPPPLRLIADHQERGGRRDRDAPRPASSRCRHRQRAPRARRTAAAPRCGPLACDQAPCPSARWASPRRTAPRSRRCRRSSSSRDVGGRLGNRVPAGRRCRRPAGFDPRRPRRAPEG